MKNQVDNRNHIATIGYVDDAIERLARMVKEGFDDTVTKAEFRAGMAELEARLGARLNNIEKNMVTKADLKAELAKFATKADLADFVTKSDLVRIINQALDARGL